MAEFLGLGITHYPPLAGTDANMAGLLRWTLADPDIPGVEKDPVSWPAPARAEWSDDGGMAAAGRHRAELTMHLARCRQALDLFVPDVVVVWGDDLDGRTMIGYPTLALSKTKQHTVNPFLGAGPRIQVIREQFVQRVSAVVDYDLPPLEMCVTEHGRDIDDSPGKKARGNHVVRNNPLQHRQSKGKEARVGRCEHERIHPDASASGNEAEHD